MVLSATQTSYATRANHGPIEGKGLKIRKQTSDQSKIPSLKLFTVVDRPPEVLVGPNDLSHLDILEHIPSVHEDDNLVCLLDDHTLLYKQED